MKRSLLASFVLLAQLLCADAAQAAFPMQPEGQGQEATSLPPPLSLTTPAAAAQETKPEAALEPEHPQAPQDNQAAQEIEREPSSVPPSLEAQGVVAAPASFAPVDLGTPVAQEVLPDIEPPAPELTSETQGGVGAFANDPWAATPPELAEKLLLTASLPTESPALNALTARLLLTAPKEPSAGAKEKGEAAHDLTALRLEKLVSLGRAQEAWQLAALAPPEQIGSLPLRLVSEAALLTPMRQEVCAKLPSLIAAFDNQSAAAGAWQKALLVCQLGQGDLRAVQLSYDMLRELGVQEDLFLNLVGKNVLGQSKTLPKTLAPLRPLDLAVLRFLDLPLPAEVYEQPEAALLGELLQARAASEKARFALAERAATSGLIEAPVLAALYESLPEPKGGFEAAAKAEPQGPLKRAYLYRAAQAAQGGGERTALAQSYLEGLDETVLTGSIGSLIAALLSDVPVEEETRAFAPQGARLYALAGEFEKAQAWLALAQRLAPRFAEVGTQLATHWPLFVLSGLGGEGEVYEQGLADWLAVSLPQDGDSDKQAARRKQVGDTLTLLAAAGYPLSEQVWLRVLEAGAPERQTLASPLLLERLRQASQAGRGGETILLSLGLAGGSASSAFATAEAVSALRQAGFKDEAEKLAREAVTRRTVP